MSSEMKMTEMEAAITRALEQRREVAVPAEFAARVVQALPPVAASRPRVAVGRTTAIAGVVVLTAALFALAPHAQPSFASFGFDVELLLMAQLCGIAYWLGKEQGLGVRG